MPTGSGRGKRENPTAHHGIYLCHVPSPVWHPGVTPLKRAWLYYADEGACVTAGTSRARRFNAAQSDLSSYPTLSPQFWPEVFDAPKVGLAIQSLGVFEAAHRLDAATYEVFHNEAIRVTICIFKECHLFLSKNTKVCSCCRIRYALYGAFGSPTIRSWPRGGIAFQ